MGMEEVILFSPQKKVEGFLQHGKIQLQNTGYEIPGRKMVGSGPPDTDLLQYFLCGSPGVFRNGHHVYLHTFCLQGYA
jgi:hypothetical protein